MNYEKNSFLSRPSGQRYQRRTLLSGSGFSVSVTATTAVFLSLSPFVNSGKPLCERGSSDFALGFISSSVVSLIPVLSLNWLHDAVHMQEWCGSARWPGDRWLLISRNQIGTTNLSSSDTTVASENQNYRTSFCCASVSNFVSVSSKDSTSESADSALEKGTSSA